MDAFGWLASLKSLISQHSTQQLGNACGDNANARPNSGAHFAERSQMIRKPGEIGVPERVHFTEF
jgi:hypothetical protein